MARRNLDYHKIYRLHFGKVPKDEHGRSYDIHHIDGDHTNNDPSNLKAVTIQEHYDIHYERSEFRACNMIALRMNRTPEQIAELNRLKGLEQVKNGKCFFTTEEHSRAVSDRVNKLVADGTYHMLGGELQRDFQIKRSEAKTHQWNGSEQNQYMLDNGTHASKIKIGCIVCKKVVDAANFGRWHGNNCKEKR